MKYEIREATGMPALQQVIGVESLHYLDKRQLRALRNISACADAAWELVDAWRERGLLI